MTWLVFAVSAILTLAGVASIISGAPIIQIERGWAEVIAGAVAVSGGATTFAIGAVLGRMRGIERALLAVRQPDAAAPPQVAPEAAELGLRQTIAEIDRPERAAAAPSASLVEAAEAAEPEPRHGLWKRIRDADVDAVEPAEVDHRPTAHPFAPADLTPVISVGMPEAREASPAITVHEDEVRHAAPEVSPGPNTGDTPEPPDTIDWLDHGLLSPRPLRPPFMSKELLLRGGGSDATAHAEHTEEPDATETELDPNPEPQQHDAAAMDAPEMAPEPVEEVTVVGRYQAGVASYVMYSDGTIEVETEGGDLRRFGSMDELKAFIARQETTVG